jgi:hypothetical protein
MEITEFGVQPEKARALIDEALEVDSKTSGEREEHPEKHSRRSRSIDEGMEIGDNEEHA